MFNFSQHFGILVPWFEFNVSCIMRQWKLRQNFDSRYTSSNGCDMPCTGCTTFQCLLLAVTAADMTVTGLTLTDYIWVCSTLKSPV